MRLVTRADLDGLTSAILLQEVVPVERVEFAHPKDVQDGKFPIDQNDILANLPYDSRAALWFDHHLSQVDEGTRGGIKGKFELAPSAARVIADHYKSPRFERYADLLSATDKLDAAALTRDDIVNPQGWVLVGYTLDPRSGLGAFKDYFRRLMALAKTKSIDEILADPEVKAHVDRLRRETEEFKRSLLETSKQNGKVVVTDVRGRKNLPSGNRFLIYDLYPDANVSVRVADGHDGTYVAIQVGRSILNRGCKTNVGALMAKFGGGGHEGAGTCQPRVEDVDRVLGEILEALERNG
ncbi:MAG TPA: exopolyphosphatase [Candidatus Baltobacteraceae bacterium]|nr:exopolyphosphatase [Candidatus Baltobacteraceae bacterium]